MAVPMAWSWQGSAAVQACGDTATMVTVTARRSRTGSGTPGAGKEVLRAVTVLKVVGVGKIQGYIKWNFSNNFMESFKTFKQEYNIPTSCSYLHDNCSMYCAHFPGDIFKMNFYVLHSIAEPLGRKPISILIAQSYILSHQALRAGSHWEQDMGRLDDNTQELAKEALKYSSECRTHPQIIHETYETIHHLYSFTYCVHILGSGANL